MRRSVPVYRKIFLYRSPRKRGISLMDIGSDIISFWRILPRNFDPIKLKRDFSEGTEEDFIVNTS